MLVRIWMGKSYQYALQRKMQLIANNIANVMTPGFKSKHLEVESVMPPDFERLLKAYETPGDENYLFEQKTVLPEYCAVIRIAQITRKFTQGAIEVTNQPLDIAIENGDGMFQVRMSDGQLAYSRAGNFTLDSDSALIDRNGHPLEPMVKIPLAARDININDEGAVFAKIGSETHSNQIGQIMLADFSHPEQLQDNGQNLYIRTPMSVEPKLNDPGQGTEVGGVRQGALELSNVNVMDAMFDMLLCQRSYEMSCVSSSQTEKILAYGAGLK